MAAVKPDRSALSSMAINGLLVAISTIIGFIIFEMSVRAYLGAPVFVNHDWRAYELRKDEPGVGVYDPHLGWTLRPNFTSSDLSTIEYGIRKNTAGPEAIEQGAILAVGDSFTAGSEVPDKETWPAHLQRISGRRVLNGGVGGYGVDQAILRAEALLADLNPSIVLVGVLAPDDVHRVGYKVYGRPKPFFFSDGDTLVRHNDPVPTRQEALETRAKWWSFATHSFVAHLLMRSVATDVWMQGASHTFEQVRNDKETVTCLLLQRLQSKLAVMGSRGMLVVQHGGWVYSRGEERSVLAERVMACARRYGFGTIDEYDTINAIARKSIDDLKSLYVMHDNNTSYGHMSGKGNAVVADVIASQLDKPVSPFTEDTAEVTPGAGVNLISGLDPSHFTTSAAVLRTGDESPPPGVDAGQVQVVEADHAKSEHYVSVGWKSTKGGLKTASFYVKGTEDFTARLQLLDDKSNGAIFDYTPMGDVRDLAKAGRPEKLDAKVQTVKDGWKRMSVTADVPGSSGSVIIQIMKPGTVNHFRDRGFGFTISGLMVEDGGTASRFTMPPTK